MIDVSGLQGDIDWRKVYDFGVRHTYIKLSEGTDYVDGRVQSNLKHARAAEVQVGVYHYAGSSVAKVLHSPLAEIRHFLRTAEQLKAFHPGDLPPALDFEETYGHPWPFLNDWKAQWFAAVDSHVGVRAVFYSYYYFWKQMVLYKDRPVWGAFLGDAPLPAGTEAWKIRQYSFTGRVDGISGHVDLDKILGDLPQLR